MTPTRPAAPGKPRGGFRGPHGVFEGSEKRSWGVALRRASLGVVLLLGATGCSADWIPNFGFPNPITDQGEWILTLWKGSVVAGLAVGVVVWGLIGWCIVAYRKRSDELPRQVRYNLPIEVLYTALPVIVICVLFYYTAIVESREDKLSNRPDLTVGVIGFQWNWQFNYVGQGVQVTGRPGVPPKLVLPADEKIRFIETSPDVIHSFWVPSFLFKRDVVPGRDNQFELTIRRPGTYIGRCAELCGVDHDRMDFFLQVLPRDQFRSWLSRTQSSSGLSSQASGRISGGGPGTSALASSVPPSAVRQSTAAQPARPAVISGSPS